MAAAGIVRPRLLSYSTLGGALTLCTQLLVLVGLLLIGGASANEAPECRLEGPLWVSQLVENVGQNGHLTFDYDVRFFTNARFEFEVSVHGSPHNLCSDNTTIRWEGSFSVLGSNLTYNFLYCETTRPSACLDCGSAIHGVTKMEFNNDCSIVVLEDFYEVDFALKATRDTLSAGIIAGIVVGSLVLVGGTIALVACFVTSQRKKNEYEDLKETNVVQ